MYESKTIRARDFVNKQLKVDVSSYVNDISQVSIVNYRRIEFR